MTKDKNIFILNIYYMLTYAFRELKQNNYEEIAGENFDNIQQLFAEILIKGISCQLKQGIFKQYIIRKDSLPTLRGKLDLNATKEKLYLQTIYRMWIPRATSARI